MKRPTSYQTKQGERVLNYLSSLSDSHVTVEEILMHFRSEEVNIGTTTVYRQLDKLVALGLVRRFLIEGSTSAAYQYIAPDSDCDSHFHLKCEDCGTLFHANDEILETIRDHIMAAYAFNINNVKTVYYGKCKACSEKN
jgi:Fur family ferric uptake transcriptional regulator